MTHVLKALSFTVTSLMIGLTACSAADDGSVAGAQPSAETESVAQDSEGLRLDVRAVDAEHLRFSVLASGAEQLRALLRDLALTEISVAEADGIAAAIVPLSRLQASADLDSGKNTAPGVHPLGLFSKKWFKLNYITLDGGSGCEQRKFLARLQAVYFWSHLITVMQSMSIEEGQCS